MGAWDPGLRQLRLNRRLLLEHGWASLVEVLKHEMAHQYVYDVLGVHDETAHGPAFRQVCADRGIDSAATGLPSLAVNVDEQRALDRVKKLLALAQSSNPHEAELAMAAAQRLVLKYNLEAFEPSRESYYGFRHLGTPRLRVSRAEHMAAAILREFFFVEVIWVQTWLPLEGRAGKVLEVCGVVENLELATYVHGFLLQAAERLWDAYRRQPGVRGMRYRQSFMAGVLSGFRDKLTDERRVQQQEGLIWVGDPGLSSYLRRRHPRQRRTTSKTEGWRSPSPPATPPAAASTWDARCGPARQRGPGVSPAEADERRGGSPVSIEDRPACRSRGSSEP